MKRLINRILLVLIVAIGTMIGLLKGAEAKQKWVFKQRERFDDRRLTEEKRSIARRGGVVLDDIELSAYHQ